MRISNNEEKRENQVCDEMKPAHICVHVLKKITATRKYLNFFKNPSKKLKNNFARGGGD